MSSCDRNCECPNNHLTIMDAFREYEKLRSKGKSKDMIPRGGSIPTPIRDNIVESDFRCRGGNGKIVNYWRGGVPVNALGQYLGINREVIKCHKC